MSLIDHAGYSEPLVLDPNRNDAVGLGVSILLPVGALAAIQAVAASLGVHGAPTPLLPFALPMPIAALLPFLLFSSWGMARWACWQAGSKGRAASWWVVGLMALVAAYPFITLALDPFLGNWFDLAVLLFAAAAAMRVAAVSRPALVAMTPSLLILTIAAIPGYVVLTGGWSPGLAITVVMAHPER